MASEGIDQLAVGIPCHGIDGEIAAKQVFLQCHAGMEIDLEAVIAVPALPLRAGQRVFLPGLGMEKNRKRAANLPITLRQQFFGRPAHHDPVFFLVGDAQKLVADSAAHQEDRPTHVSGLPVSGNCPDGTDAEICSDRRERRFR